MAGGEMNEGVKALFKFAELFLPSQLDTFRKMYHDGTLQFSTMKDAVAEAIFDELRKIQDTRNKIQTKDVERVVQEGATKARAIAQKTVAEVRQKMGLG